MSINSLNSSSSTMMLDVMQGKQRPDPSKMTEQLFAKLDTKGQGYIEKSDLETALGKVSQSGNSSSSSSSKKAEAEAMFSKMDSNGDGKLTKEEMSATVQKIASELDGSFPKMRMQGGQGSVVPADTNGDRKVSDKEKITFEESKKTFSTNSNTVTSSSSSASNTNAQSMKQVMQLLHAYGGHDKAAGNSSFSASV